MLRQSWPSVKLHKVYIPSLYPCAAVGTRHSQASPVTVTLRRSRDAADEDIEDGFLRKHARL